MPKIGRAGPGDSSKGGRRGARRTSKKTAPKAPKRAANWFAAQMRAARLRMVYAVRLAGLAVAVIAAAIIAIYAAMGRLDEAGGALLASFENNLTRSGYVVEWVDVTGAERLSVEQVAQIIGAQPGAGLADIDLVAAKAALEAQSWVESARIVRLWPDRIVVRLEEREAFALWQLDGEHRVIDPAGVVIEAADPANFAQLPRVVGFGANEGAAAILASIRSHPEIERRTTHALYVGERRWSLRLASGTDILLPEAGFGEALALLAGMHSARGVLDYEAQLLDLRNEGEMVMRPWPDRAAEAAGRGA